MPASQATTTLRMAAPAIAVRPPTWPTDEPDGVAASTAAVSSAPLPNFSRAEATTKETTVAVSTVRIIGMCPPGPVTAKYARIDPGEAGATRPAPVSVATNRPDMEPRIIATIMIGFIRTYGK